MGRHSRLIPAAAVTGALLLLAGCTSAAESGAGAEAEQRTTAAPSTTAAPPAPPPRLGEDPAVEEEVDELLASMTIEEKVGQTVQADIAAVTPEEVREYHLGSVLAGGSSDPGGQIDAPPQAWLDLVDQLYDASVDPAGGAAIPILFGIDAVHGNGNVVGATLFPHNIGLGATRDAELVRAIGEATAVESRATGVDWVFAPTLAVPQDLRWGRTYEGYAEDPEIVAELGPAIVQGLQGEVATDEYLDPQHVLATVKHFVGDGGTTGGDDQGDTDLTDEQLLALHGAGYPPSIDAGAGSVMASFNSVRGQKMHGNEYLLTDVLKGDLGFNGFVISDWNGHGQIPGCTNEDCTLALEAGVDMVMAPATWKGYYQSLLLHVQAGDVSEARLDEAVRRILRVKVQMGLLEAGRPSERPLGGQFAVLADPEHRSLARRAVQESLVLLKNEDGLLPLDPTTDIVVTGSAADDLARQSGGWSLTWQGTGTDRSMFPNGTTIWEGFEEQIEAAGGTATLSPDGTFATAPDAAVVVFGEHPYAEGLGDVNTLALSDDAADLALMRTYQDLGIPVVAVLLSGRPLWVNRELNASDAFVAAWLPGSEGGGIADVLLADAAGQVQHQPSGTLSYSWPATADQFTADQRRADGLFPLGFGLTYDDDGTLEHLSEELDASGDGETAFFADGAFGPGASFRVVGPTDDSVQVPANGLLESAIRVRPEDRARQEDARRLTWDEAAQFQVSVIEPIDLRAALDQGRLLVIEVQVHRGATGSVTLGMGCATSCSAADATDAFARAVDGDWTTIGMPLSCLGSAGALGSVSQPLVLDATAALDLSISAVRLGDDAEETLTC